MRGSRGVTSGFHAWLTRSLGDRAILDTTLVAGIDTSLKASDPSCGARRVLHDVLEEGLICDLHRIERLMRQNALRARPKRRATPRDDGERSVIADNILDRDFEADRPNQKWLADFTYIRTAQGSALVGLVLECAWQQCVVLRGDMLVQNPVGIALAALLSSPRLRFAAVYRTAIFIPAILSFVVVGFVWKLILSPIWGIAPGLLDAVGLKSLFAPWLGKESYALTTLALISVWQFVGIPMMLIYAALISIPEEVIEAAEMDGVTGAAQFWKIKLPLILP